MALPVVRAVDEVSSGLRMSEPIKRTIDDIAPFNETARRVATHRQDVLTKPRGSLGMLEHIAADVAGVMATPEPSPEPCALVLAAGDHGVVEEGVSAYPGSVTAQMVRNFLAGGAAINAIAHSVGVRIYPVDAGVDEDFGRLPGLYDRKLSRGSRNFVREPAMSSRHAEGIVAAGIELAVSLHELGYGAIALGDMGIGNTASAAAVTALMTGRDAAGVTGRGTMVGKDRYRHKIRVVDSALDRHAAARDGLSVLAAVGGYETGFLAGCVLGAASRRLPVILDGFPTTAAALIACELCTHARRYCFAGHLSTEPGHRIALEHLGLAPLLNLGMRLGEGAGAVLAYSLIRAACRCLNEMATFTEASVAGKLD